MTGREHFSLTLLLPAHATLIIMSGSGRGRVSGERAGALLEVPCCFCQCPKVQLDTYLNTVLPREDDKSGEKKI